MFERNSSHLNNIITINLQLFGGARINAVAASVFAETFGVVARVSYFVTTSNSRAQIRLSQVFRDKLIYVLFSFCEFSSWHDCVFSFHYTTQNVLL